MDWLKQKPDEPLFKDVLWSRPENRRHAGKLLVIGGHKQEFNEVSKAYSAALKAGAGSVRVILPDSLQRMLFKLFPEAEYAMSNQIGSFSRQALGTLLDAAQWADAVLLAGDFGRNSETAVLLDSFAEKYAGKLALTGDSIDYFLTNSQKLTKRPETLVIADLAQTQKLAMPALVQQNADFIKVIGQTSDWIAATELALVTHHSNQVITAVKQQISTSAVNSLPPTVDLAAYAAVWWLQQPEKPFEALTSAVFSIAK